MTGYGKAECLVGQKKISIEIRSVNSKQLDLNLRMPFYLREKESDIKTVISKTVERGKVDMSVYAEKKSDTEIKLFDHSLIKKYYDELKKLSKELKVSNENIFSEVLKLPDVVRKNENEVLSELEWKTINKSILIAIKNFNSFREQEGKALEKDLSFRIKNILLLLKKTDSADKARIEMIKKRIKKNMEEIIPVAKFDTNRFEQELIYYIEKLDITEEKVRLKNHCDYFLITMKEENNCGRKLGFISQEIGREINTIGSKANHTDIQKMVVEMKDELEKVKEQLNNVL